MLDIVDLLFKVGVAAGKALGITLYALSDVSLPPLHQVVPIEMSSAPYVAIRVRPKTEEERCLYSGVVVPYEQLWEERTKNSFGGETLVPPQPGQVAAYALVINRKDCEGRKPEAMFRVATHRRTMFNSERLMEGASYAVLDVGGMSTDARPKWLQQVLETIEGAAKDNPVAQQFTEFMEASAKAERQ